MLAPAESIQLEAQPRHRSRRIGRPQRGALSNEVLAVIGEQTDFHRLLVEVRDGELVDAVLDYRAGDRERVDLIGLAGATLAAAGRAHPVRSYPHDPLAGRHRERTRDEAGEAGDAHSARRGVRARDGKDQTDVRDQTVVDAEDSGACAATRDGVEVDVYEPPTA